jgi:hypothetical protein
MDQLVKAVCKPKVHTSRAVCIEDPGNAHIHAVLSVKPIGEGLGNAFSFIVTGPGSDGVHMAPAEKDM